jgi:hypothetical protein
MSTSCLINSARLKVWKHSGTEGPRFDPYGYDQYEIHRKGRASLTVHLGLDNWAQLGKQKRRSLFGQGKGRERYELDKRRLDAVVERACGYTLAQLERFARKARSRCPCGSKSFEEACGYPGEHVTMCAECHRVMSVTFNEAAVI